MAQRSRRVTKLMALNAVMILSFCVLMWSANWNVDIGVHASDTNTGGGNTAAWLWFLGSFAAFVTSLVAVVAAGVRSRQVRRSRHHSLDAGTNGSQIHDGEHGSDDPGEQPGHGDQGDPHPL